MQRTLKGEGKHRLEHVTYINTENVPRASREPTREQKQEGVVGGSKSASCTVAWAAPTGEGAFAKGGGAEGKEQDRSR